MKTILFVFGTRPEAIKLAPVIREFRKHADVFRVKLCLTAQHREMLDQVLEFFQLSPDYDLDLMTPNQSTIEFVCKALVPITSVMQACRPDVVFVQGDTTTAFIGALAAYCLHIKIAHVEAGLRSNDKCSPFPEEMNRVLIGQIADFHFAPTQAARANLAREGITSHVEIVGNTVVDALLVGSEIIGRGGDGLQNVFSEVDFDRRIVLVTGHRRESFGLPFVNICKALRELAEKYRDVEIVYPVHLNPNVSGPVRRTLAGIENIHLFEPLPYHGFLYLMSRCYLVLTDSGGVQEEAPSLGKPVLVMRETTERIEGIAAGTAKLVGTTSRKIVEETSRLLDDADAYRKMSRATNTYGDGTASKRIVATVRGWLDEHTRSISQQPAEETSLCADGRAE